MEFCEKCDERLDDLDLELTEMLFQGQRKICKNCVGGELEKRKERKKEIAFLMKSKLKSNIWFFIVPQFLLIYSIIGSIVGTIYWELPFLLCGITKYTRMDDTLFITIDVLIMLTAFVLGIIGSVSLWRGRFLADSTTLTGHHYETTVESSGKITTKKVNEYSGGGEWFVNLLMIIIGLLGIIVAGTPIGVIKQKKHNRLCKALQPEFSELKNLFERIDSISLYKYDSKGFSSEFNSTSLKGRYNDYSAKCARREYIKEEIKDIGLYLESLDYKGKKMYYVGDIGRYYIFCYQAIDDELHFYVGYRERDWILCMAEDLSYESLREVYIKKDSRGECDNLLTDTRIDLKSIIQMQKTA